MTETQFRTIPNVSTNITISRDGHVQWDGLTVENHNNIITDRDKNDMTVWEAVKKAFPEDFQLQPDFMRRAKVLVSDDYNTTMPYGVVSKQSSPGDFYVVWFAKALGNWKALVSTDIAPGLYWEVTHNGAKMETYVDRYVKQRNRVYSYDALPDFTK